MPSLQNTTTEQQAWPQPDSLYSAGLDPALFANLGLGVGDFGLDWMWTGQGAGF